jgi:hypothetical protein
MIKTIPSFFFDPSNPLIPQGFPLLDNSADTLFFSEYNQFAVAETSVQKTLSLFKKITAEIRLVKQSTLSCLWAIQSTCDHLEIRMNRVLIQPLRLLKNHSNVFHKASSFFLKKCSEITPTFSEKIIQFFHQKTDVFFFHKNHLFRILFLMKKLMLFRTEKKYEVRMKVKNQTRIFREICPQKQGCFSLSETSWLKLLNFFLADIQCIMTNGEKKMKNNLDGNKILSNIAPSN